MISVSAFDRSFVPVRAACVAEEELDTEVILYHEVANTVHVLSPTASLVWKSIDGLVCLEDLAATFSEVFDVALERMNSDILAVVRDFGKQGLLSGVRPDAEVVAASLLSSAEISEQPSGSGGREEGLDPIARSPYLYVPPDS